MKYLKEVTVWDKVEYNVPNHTYIFDGSKCVGYIKEGTTEKIIWDKPSKQFDKRNRKFVEISLDT